MSLHFYRYPIESGFGIEVLTNAGCCLCYAKSFLFVRALSILKAPSLEKSTQLRTRSFEC